MSIAELIPSGIDNSISRQNLTRACAKHGLLDLNRTDPDRQMRKLLQEARHTNVILSNPKGGYYKPTYDEAEEIRDYISKETERAIAIFESIKMAKALYDDLLCDRLEGGALLE